MDKITQIVKSLLGDESFHRFVNGTASDAEQYHWKHWIGKSEENEKAMKQASQLLKDLRFRMAYRPDVDESWQNFKSKKKLTKQNVYKKGYRLHTRSSRILPMLRYVAVFLVVSLLTTTYWLVIRGKKPVKLGRNITLAQVSTGYREQKTLNFSDGSKIILAPNSHIIYKTNWLTKKIKKIKLVGQAYFDIADTHPNREAKFEIKTQFGIIRDFGTIFNVSTYGHHADVVLVRGVVSITPNDSNKKREIKLQPGQMATLSSGNNQILVNKVDTRVYTSWTTKTLFFKKTPLRKFIDDVKDFYGVPVVVNDPSLLSKKLSGGVDRGSLPSMIKVVSSVLGVPLSVKNDTLYVGDIFNSNTNKQ